MRPSNISWILASFSSPFLFSDSFSDEHSVTDASVANSITSDDDSSLGDSSHEGLSALEMLQASDRAAALIQKQFRNSLARRAPPLMMASSGAAAIALALIGAKHVTFDLPDITEATEREDTTESSETEDTDGEVEEEEETHRSGKHLWGIARIAGTFIGATIIGGMAVSTPVDEDDVIALSVFLNAGGGGGGGGGGAGAGAGLGVGAGAGGGGGAAAAAGGGGGAAGSTPAQ
jgi:hypothetical protein